MILLKKEMTSLLRINYFRYRPPASDCIHEKQVEWPYLIVQLCEVNKPLGTLHHHTVTIHVPGCTWNNSLYNFFRFVSMVCITNALKYLSPCFFMADTNSTKLSIGCDLRQTRKWLTNTSAPSRPAFLVILSYRVSVIALLWRSGLATSSRQEDKWPVKLSRQSLMHLYSGEVILSL